MDVENEDAMKCKLNERGWQIPCEIVIYQSISHFGSAIFSQNFAFVTTFEVTFNGSRLRVNQRIINRDQIFKNHFYQAKNCAKSVN